jgi:hypothetical protein
VRLNQIQNRPIPDSPEGGEPVRGPDDTRVGERVPEPGYWHGAEEGASTVNQKFRIQNSEFGI